ncbi:VanZ family protein [Roseiconus lacunae]|uniref:VanZ-like domain-containing protein n=1 Tax=Roseiconus lacunae TaxID=2605694 RepID=A0ABT7PS44_9BACT|nr:hypothetical protein [Roseiconus lacunae]MCD0460329.1 hypothetical protein [Roseiconus lacunae]MDM4018931.1 hypothetical protein [Roseiconus lacunae]
MKRHAVRPTDHQRFTIAWIWCIATLMLATYTLLKPSTSAQDLFGLPNSFVQWLDKNYNLRTFIMTFLIGIGPALCLAGQNYNRIRRIILTVILAVLVGLEFCQIAIPTRGFSWPDVFYTVGGVIVCEMLAIGIVLYWHGNGLEHLVFGSDRTAARNKRFFAWACIVLILMQLALVFGSSYLPNVSLAILPTWLAEWLRV